MPSRDRAVAERGFAIRDLMKISELEEPVAFLVSQSHFTRLVDFEEPGVLLPSMF